MADLDLRLRAKIDNRSRARSMVITRLCKKNTWPCRSSSRLIASRMSRSS
jgi:hypothetical protein